MLKTNTYEMDLKEELSNSLVHNISSIKTEIVESTKYEDYFLENTVKQIKEEITHQDNVGTELLQEEYDAGCIKNESDIFFDYPIEPGNRRHSLDNRKNAKKHKRKKKTSHSCPVCQKNFLSSLKRENHFMIHFNRSYVICFFCGKIFLHRELYILHYFSHFLNMLKRDKSQVKHQKTFSENLTSEKCIKKDGYIERRPYKCKICSKHFTQSGHLYTHMRVHTGDKPYTCEICSKNFTQSGNLRTHMRGHSEERPFTCKICSKSFKRRSILEGHMFVHIEEKPFKCEICSKSFTQRSNLERHMLVHTGERPFKCEICSKSFFTNCLKKHKCIKPREKPFKCEMCFKTFTRNHSLKVHRKNKRPCKIIKLDICSRNVIQINNLNPHMVVHTEDKLLKGSIHKPVK